jgi:hypothetical protein
VPAAVEALSGNKPDTAATFKKQFTLAADSAAGATDSTAHPTKIAVFPSEIACFDIRRNAS